MITSLLKSKILNHIFKNQFSPPNFFKHLPIFLIVNSDIWEDHVIDDTGEIFFKRLIYNSPIHT